MTAGRTAHPQGQEGFLKPCPTQGQMKYLGCQDGKSHTGNYVGQCLYKGCMAQKKNQSLLKKRRWEGKKGGRKGTTHKQLAEAGTPLGDRIDSDTRVPIGIWLHKALPWFRLRKAFTASMCKADATSGAPNYL